MHSSIKGSPRENFTGNKPTIKHIKVFGCKSFFFTDDSKSKFHIRAQQTIFLGFDDNNVFTGDVVSDRKILNSMHLTFDETSFPGL